MLCVFPPIPLPKIPHFFSKPKTFPLSPSTNVHIRSATFPDCYLRIDGAGVDPSSGSVNCQERVAVSGLEEFQLKSAADGTMGIVSVAFPNVYLKMDGDDVQGHCDADAGAGVVGCQLGCGPLAQFKLEPQADGTTAISSVAFPDIYLRMDGREGQRGTGYPVGFGVVNCSTSVGPWEKFIISEVSVPLTREELERAIGTYGPTLLLHPDEKYNNTSVEYFLQHATLVSKRGAEIPHPTVDQLPQSGDPGEYWLRLDLEAAKAGDFTAAKAYVRAHWVPGQTYTDLQFWLFSAYNGPGSAHINGLVFNKIVHSGDVVLEPLGEHFGDWECIVVRIDHQSKEMSGVWLSQHAKGRFYTRDEIYSNFKLLRATHPIVYSSLNGHANYASPGLNPSEYHKVPPGGIPAGIEFELRNDTAEGGRILDCSQKYELISADFLTGADAIREPKWVTYPFRWGPEGTATHMSPHDVGEILRAAFGERVPEGVVKVVDELAALVLPYFVKDDLNGAEAPQTHDAWRGSYPTYGT